jgi:hypothetical protein
MNPILITVARPRGIHTRFPILPQMGAPRHFDLTKNDNFRLMTAGQYHADLQSVKLRTSRVVS